MNAIVYAKLMLIAKMAEFFPRHQGKQLPTPTVGSFSEHTIAAYRKVLDHSGELDAYWRYVTADVF